MKRIRYEEKTPLKNDYLWCLKVYGFVLPTTKISKILLIICSLLFGTTYFVLIPKYLTTCTDLRNFKKFIPLLMLEPFILGTIPNIFTKTNTLYAAFKTLPLWEIDSAGETIKKRILERAKYTKCTMLINIICVSVAGLCFGIRQELDEQYMLELYFLHKYFGEFGYYLGCVGQLFCFAGSYFCMIQGVQCTYIIEHIICQNEMLAEYLRNIDCSPKVREEEKLRSDENYQKEVKKRLIFCVKREQEFERLLKVLNEFISTQMVSYTLGSILFAIGSILYIVVLENITPLAILRFTSTLVGTILIGIRMLHCGQEIENESTRFRITCTRLKWYLFNRENLQNYKIILLIFLKEQKLIFSENYTINYRYSLKVLKAIYSIFSLAVNYY